MKTYVVSFSLHHEIYLWNRNRTKCAETNGRINGDFRKITEQIFCFTLICFRSHWGFAISPLWNSLSVGQSCSISFPLASLGTATRFSSRFIGVEAPVLSPTFSVPQSKTDENIDEHERKASGFVSLYHRALLAAFRIEIDRRWCVELKVWKPAVDIVSETQDPIGRAITSEKRMSEDLWLFCWIRKKGIRSSSIEAFRSNEKSETLDFDWNKQKPIEIHEESLIEISEKKCIVRCSKNHRMLTLRISGSWSDQFFGRSLLPFGERTLKMVNEY